MGAKEPGQEDEKRDPAEELQAGGQGDGAGQGVSL